MTPRAVRVARARRGRSPGRPLATPPAWDSSGVDPRHPGPGVHDELFSAYYEAPVAPVVTKKGIMKVAGRSATVRFCGPLGSPRHVAEPAVLRSEARRLLDVAATLEAIQEATGDGSGE